MESDVAGYQRRTTVLQVASTTTTAITLFVVFRLTVEIVSADFIGIWSLVGGLFLVARVGDSGAGSNISRVVATRAKARTPLDLRNFLAASIMIAGLPSIVLASILAPAIGWYVTDRFGAQLDMANLWVMVWLGLLYASLLIVSNILFALCEGVFELNYKSAAVISSNLLGIASVYPLLVCGGPVGIALIYVVIGATQLTFAIVRVVRLMAGEPRLRLSSVRRHIGVLWRDNMQLSFVALIRLSFEPATKLFLSLFAPLFVIAQFELALRVTTQIRVVIQSAIQPLLAVGARNGNNESSSGLRDLFVRNDRVLFRLSIAAIIAQILGAPAIQAAAGLGSDTAKFVGFFTLLAIGNAFSTMGIAGYYWQLTSGALLPLIRLQLLMAFANMAIGVVAVYGRSEMLVVAGYSAAFATGGLIARSFLSHLSTLRKLASVAITVAVATVSAGLVIIVNPQTLTVVALFVFAGIFGAAIALYGVRDTIFAFLKVGLKRG